VAFRPEAGIVVERRDAQDHRVAAGPARDELRAARAAEEAPLAGGRFEGPQLLLHEIS